MDNEIWSARRIRAFRRKYHITRKELAKMVGVSHATVYAWEHMNRPPSLRVSLLLTKIKGEMKW